MFLQAVSRGLFAHGLKSYPGHCRRSSNQLQLYRELSKNSQHALAAPQGFRDPANPLGYAADHL